MPEDIFYTAIGAVVFVLMIYWLIREFSSGSKSKKSRQSNNQNTVVKIPESSVVSPPEKEEAPINNTCSCGNRLSPDVYFCDNCGKRIKRN